MKSRKNGETRVPEVVHEDGASRAQVLRREFNPRYCDLMAEPEKLTGNGVVLNTSLHHRGEPMRAPDINGSIGALARKGATRGVFVTTSRYTNDAKEIATEVRNQRVKLIDGTELVKLAIEYKVGVSVRRRLEIKRLDLDYFEEFEES